MAPGAENCLARRTARGRTSAAGHGGSRVFPSLSGGALRGFSPSNFNRARRCQATQLFALAPMRALLLLASCSQVASFSLLPSRTLALHAQTAPLPRVVACAEDSGDDEFNLDR